MERENVERLMLFADGMDVLFTDIEKQDLTLKEDPNLLLNYSVVIGLVDVNVENA